MKVNTRVPNFVYNILMSDCEYFKIKLGSLSNKIIKYYMNKEFYNIKSEYKNTENIQFNLDKYNEIIFFDEMIRHKIEVNSEYLRCLYFQYINNLKTNREKILFNSNFKILQKSIENKEKIKINYHNKLRKVDPYFIKEYEKEGRSYLFCYCYDNNDYRNYKISDIRNIYPTNEKYEIIDKKYVNDIKNNFDPFLSYNNIVKVKLTERGKNLYEIIQVNRPKLLKEEDGFHYFECDKMLALIYFAQFYNEIEIIEPIELRERIKGKVEKMMEIYK